MSWKLTGIVSRKRLGSQSRKLLLLSMADKANDDGTGIYASFQTLADMCESSRATVKRLIKQFEDDGLVFHAGMHGNQNGAQTNNYSIDIDALTALPDIETKKAKTRVTLDPVQKEPGSPRSKTRVAAHPVQHEPGSPCSKTRVTVNPKPILEPKTLTLTTFELESAPVEKPKAKSAKKACTPTPYTPAFQMIWLQWPKHKRRNSDKREAFKRYLVGVEQFGAEAVAAAANGYLSLPDTYKEQWRYCCAVEVFMNGRLEAAVEAVRENECAANRTFTASEQRLLCELHMKGEWPSDVSRDALRLFPAPLLSEFGIKLAAERRA